MSPAEQPPLPLQLFIPLQSCLFMLESDDAVPELEQPVMVMALPASNPVIAVVRMMVLVVRFIALLSCSLLLLLLRTEPDPGSRSLGMSQERPIPFTQSQNILCTCAGEKDRARPATGSLGDVTASEWRTTDDQIGL